MPLLALDACFGALSVALEWQAADGTRRLVHSYEEMALGHAERIVPMIRDVAREAGIRPRDVDRIAVTLGPGSFTGVRTGISVARALALTTGAPVLGATSLAVMAETAVRRWAAAGASPSPAADILVAVDARRGEAYAQRFQGSGARPLTSAELLPLADIVASLPAEGCIAIGSAAPALRALAGVHGRPLTVVFPNLQPDAAALVALVPHLHAVDPVVPLYIRPPDARPPTGGSLPRA